MKSDEIAIHICDDWISFKLPDSEMIYSACSALSAYDWQEIIPGLDSVAVQFDPARLSPDEAVRRARQQLENAEDISLEAKEIIEIPVCYAKQYAPDLEWVARKLSMSETALTTWHSKLNFKVSMIGFMPGFAYLKSEEPVANIGRFEKPRQKVAAGSIGIIGDQSCIYSFDSPGGWPIIGRTPVQLFDKSKSAPSLLSANQTITFRAVDEYEYLELSADGR